MKGKEQMKILEFLRKNWAIWAVPGFIVTICLIAALAQRLIGTFFYALNYSVVIGLFLSFFSTFFILRKNGKLLRTAFLSATSVALISALSAFAFLGTVPLNVDRSFTVWSLNQLGKSDIPGGKISVEELKVGLSRFFEPESGEISRRLKEQLSIGNIAISHGLVSLTDQGMRQREMFRIISLIFDLNPKYAQ